jgi:hypothetical protein
MSANGTFSVAKEKGPIKTIPEIPGVCVWRNGHIGVYIGNGQVIEAKGTKYGVVQTPLTGPGSNNWTHWLKHPQIEYIDETDKYKSVIQEHCNFSDPEGLWKYLDKYPYADDVYRKIASSYH